MTSGSEQLAKLEEPARVRPEAPLEACSGRPVCSANVRLAGGSFGGPLGPRRSTGKAPGVGGRARQRVSTWGAEAQSRGQAPCPGRGLRALCSVTPTPPCVPRGACPHLCQPWATGQGRSTIYGTANPGAPPGGGRPLLAGPLMTGLGHWRGLGGPVPAVRGAEGGRLPAGGGHASAQTQGAQSSWAKLGIQMQRRRRLITRSLRCFL